MNMNKILALSILGGLMTSLQAVASEAKPCASGEQNCWQCGDNCYARLDADGLMTFAGTGDMWSPDWSTLLGRWGAQRANIKAAVVEEGITSIGRNTFYDSALETITIADSVTWLDNFAFERLTSLKTINIGENSALQRMESTAFNDTDKQSMNIICNGSNNGCQSAFSFFTQHGIGKSYTSENANGRATYDFDGNQTGLYEYDRGRNLIKAMENGVEVYRRRIYTPAEATAAVSGKNTFKLKYR